MKKISSNNQVEFFKPPAPKARPPIRNINENKETDTFKSFKNLLVKKNMYKTKYQNPETHYISDNEYTDDEDYDESDEEDNINDSLNTSQNSVQLESFSTPHTSISSTQVHRRSFHNSNTSQVFNTSNNSFSYKVKDQPTKGFFSKYFFLCIIIACCILFPIILLNTQTKSHEDIEAITKAKDLHLTEINKILHKTIQIIQTRFHNQKVTIWNDISAGIYDVVLFHTKPSTIILFGNEINTLNCLAQLLAQLSGKILGSNDYLILTPKDFPNDVGEVIHNLKLPIIQKKAIIVQDLLSINSEAIKAFHNFCDRENPLVENAVYIITVVVDGYTSSQRELEFIEKKIFKRLSKDLDKDILDPLITRLTDGVIVPVLSESNTNINYTDCSFL